MDVLVVISRITSLFLIMVVGWMARRRGYLDAPTTTSLGRFVVDLTLPALVFVQMVRTVDRGTWRDDLSMLVISGMVMLVALGIGWASSQMVGKEERGTFAFLVGVPNWIYLPLPIAEELYGDAGLRAVLIGNISAQVLLWTLGVATLRGKLLGGGIFRQGIVNPGILSAVLGIALALLVPGSSAWTDPSGSGMTYQAMHALFSAMEMLGSVTVPLSLLVIGAQLGGVDIRMRQPGWTVTGVLVVRLFAAPLITFGLSVLAQRMGVHLPNVPKRVAYLIASMPVAVSCSVIVERFGGNTILSARAIAHTTLLSAATVPAMFWLTNWIDP